MDLFQRDFLTTNAHRSLIRRNRNLLHWYKSAYDEMLGSCVTNEQGRILEIGSGASPLKEFYPDCMTSDILRLEYVDHVFDCMHIDQYDGITDHSLDALLLINALHHIKQPIEFLIRARKKLADHGKIILLEPFISLLSYPIYRYLHYERMDFTITEPDLADVQGPLSSANLAMPYLVFFQKNGWLQRIAHDYDLTRTKIGYFSGLSYFATGGVSVKIPVPHALYKICMAADLILARRFPRIAASFFVATLSTRLRNEESTVLTTKLLSGK